MILQALVSYYEDLVAQNEIIALGWGTAKVSFVLCINSSGDITRVISMKEEHTFESGKTETMVVPAPVKRSSGVAPNFLCDNSTYMLGIDNKGKPDWTRERFDATCAIHKRILDGIHSDAARAVIQFFSSWDPLKAKSNSLLQPYWENIISGGNLVFRYEGDGQGQYVQKDPDIAAAWERYYFSLGDGPEMICLVTGEKGPVEAIHPAIKGINGAKASGAALVSFNKDAYESYGKKQNYNAPTSQYAAFAYTSALNYLIADKERLKYIGDTAVLCWAKGGNNKYTTFANLRLLGDTGEYTEKEIADKAKRLLKGETIEFEQTKLNPEQPFYILGIAPNAARLSVRFFFQNSFGYFLSNVEKHYERLTIVHSPFDKRENIPIWLLLNETVNQKSKNKKPASGLAGEVLRAIITDTRYPASLLNGVNLRIRAEKEITRGRAAIIKAYYLKNNNPDVPEEVLQVGLNKDSRSLPYTLGRLFAVLESIQYQANREVKSTIKDRYFNSASATPGRVFPTLINLAQNHLRKIKTSAPGKSIELEKRLMNILDKVDTEFPARMNLAEQGAFQLGYYHQRQMILQSGKEKEKE